ncbi:MAG: dienelactone hydrolase family protein [Arcicella sp.]|jgi:carboxymethylenebutenolidase|nr:dienelactone hydrolase family protein [Arcicella sp.]
MKRLFLTLMVAGFSYVGFSQSCCSSASKADCDKDDMQLMASTKEFQKAHEEPLPYTHVSKAGGEMIQFNTPDGKTANAFLIKSAKQSNNYLFVYQEWWGLNDHIKKQAEVFYNDLKDVNVVAIDMYDGKIATTADEAGKLMSGADQKRLGAIIEGAIKFAGANAKIASVGWCFGGGLSLKSALLEGKQAVGCVMYYGMPEKDVEKLKTLNCDVLGLFAAREKWISPEVVAQFEKNMAAAGKSVKVKNYDAEHAFANPSNPKFDKVASEDAYGLAINYLKSKF